MITTPNITHYLLWRRRGGGWGFAASLRKLNGRIRPKLTFAYKGGWVGGLKFVKIGLRNIGTPPYEGLMWITSVLYIGNCELYKIRTTKTVFCVKTNSFRNILCLKTKKFVVHEKPVRNEVFVIKILMFVTYIPISLPSGGGGELQAYVS